MRGAQPRRARRQANIAGPRRHRRAPRTQNGDAPPAEGCPCPRAEGGGVLRVAATDRGELSDTIHLKGNASRRCPDATAGGVDDGRAHVREIATIPSIWRTADSTARLPLLAAIG